MAVNNSLKFYKGWYGSGLSKVLPDEPKAIIFNEEEGLIYVNGKCYGGATDASFDKGVLHITFSDGRDGIDIDFTDTASASSVLSMLEKIESAIGGDVLGSGSDSENGLDYNGTNYLTGTETLVEADRNLDTVLKDVDDRVTHLEKTDLATETWVEENYVGKSDTVNATLITYDDTNTGMGTQQNPVSTAQRAIEVIDSRLDVLESLPDFETVICSTASNTPSGVVWNDGQDDVTGNLAASVDTMHTIYLVPVNTGSSDTTDWYDEYLSIKNGDSYSWTKIGTTKTDLNGYVKTIVVNGKSYEVAANGTTVTLTDVITGITGESETDLNNTDFINVSATTTKDTTLGTNVTVLGSSVKVVSVDDASSENNGLATALDVKTKINTVIGGLDADFTGNSAASDTNGNVTVSLKEEDGVVTTLGVDVNYATVTKTAGTNGSDTTIEVTSGDENKLVIGSDITKLAEFTNARISEEIGKLNSDVTSSGSDDPIEFSVTQQGGLITGVEVSMLGAEVSFDGTGSDEALEVENENGVVIGSDILKMKEYVDSKFMSDGTTVTNSNGSGDAISVVATTDSHGNKNYDINIVWSEFSDENGN